MPRDFIKIFLIHFIAYGTTLCSLLNQSLVNVQFQYFAIRSNTQLITLCILLFVVVIVVIMMMI